jgi:hypothetical protein
MLRTKNMEQPGKSTNGLPVSSNYRQDFQKIEQLVGAISGVLIGSLSGNALGLMLFNTKCHAMLIFIDCVIYCLFLGYDTLSNMSYHSHIHRL